MSLYHEQQEKYIFSMYGPNTSRLMLLREECAEESMWSRQNGGVKEDKVPQCYSGLSGST